MSETLAVAAIQQISVDQIKPSRHQARKDFDEEGIKQLAVSIDKEDLIQPITLRKVGEEYELISGERRLRAVKSLGRSTIEARVIEVVNEAAACAKGLVENLQREDLNPIEEAEGFVTLNKLDSGYWTQAKMAEISGKTVSRISETMRFIGLSEKIKDDFRQRKLTQQHGAELLRLPSQELQDKVANKIQKKEMTVKQTREAVNKLLAKLASKADPANDHADEPEASFKFSGKAMDAWVSFSGHYPIIGNWDDFVMNLRNAYEAWRAKGIKGRKKAAAAKAETVVSADSAMEVDHPAKPTLSLSAAIKTLSPEEVVALADITKDGPGPIYAKLLPGTHLAKMMENSTWAKFGAKDVKDGLPLMLEAIRSSGK